MFKKLITGAINQIFWLRSERALNKRGNNLIKFLKREGLYKKYPVQEPIPVISECNFYTKADKKWLDIFYSTYGQADRCFITLPAFNNYIEPCLNNYLLNRAIKEKNFYDKFLKGINTPPTPIRRIHGNYFDSDYNFIELTDTRIDNILSDIPEVIIKPSVVSGSGKLIKKFERKNGGLWSGEEKLTSGLLIKYVCDFVLQKVIRQHDYFRKFNPDSNNTVRVLTYRSLKDESINILHILLRIGKKGSFLDHDNLGGVVVSIDNTGKLNDFSTDTSGKRYKSFNEIIFENESEVPFIDDIKKTSILIAKQIHYGRLLAIDLTIDQEGKILLIEINSKGNGISQYQYNNGSLFKEFTREVLNHCSSHIPDVHLIQV